MYEDDESGPKGTFEIHKAEADALCKQGEYRKSIESYTTALELQANDKNCLVARSKCYLQLGDTKNALIDAQASLADEPTFHKGIYQKAQALYYQGDFEMALVFYHRGLKLRPELTEFRLGIQKAQEAIDNSVGSPDKVKLTTDGDLTYFTAQYEKKRDRKAPSLSSYHRPLTSIQGGRQKRLAQAPRSAGSERTIKQLLGELYGDRQYLEKLLKETDSRTDVGKTISSLVEEGLQYLDTRTDFWRQQKPMYARKHERLMQRRNREIHGQSAKFSPNEHILQELEKIDYAQVDGQYQEALKKCEKLMQTVEAYSQEQVPNKLSVIANLHSCMGNAYLEMGMYNKALECHQHDLRIGEEHNMEEALSRGLDNMGRVYARNGKFDKAVELWERKLPLSKSSLESTWLFHEIGRCYLELGDFSKAKEYGEKSSTAAEDADDDMWQLQASVLVAQSEVKQGELRVGQKSFEKALSIAKSAGDRSAEAAIRRAMGEVSKKLMEGQNNNSMDEDVMSEAGNSGETEARQMQEETEPQNDEVTEHSGPETEIVNKTDDDKQELP